MIAIGATVRIEGGREHFRIIGYECGGEVIQLEDLEGAEHFGRRRPERFSVYQWRVRYT